MRKRSGKGELNEVKRSKSKEKVRREVRERGEEQDLCAHKKTKGLRDDRRDHRQKH